MRPIATVDVTGKCPLRCRHCYYFAGAGVGDLDDETLLARLATARDALGIRSVLWLGGEPLLRAKLLRRAAPLFARNAVVTSATVPIPHELDMGLLVSIDGPAHLHDRLRGSGAYALALRHLRRSARRGFALLATLTAETLGAIEHLPRVVAETGARGALVGFFYGAADHPLSLSGGKRERAVDRLLELASAHPDVVLNSVAALELFRPARARSWGERCIYRHQAIAFDTKMQPKAPCSYGGAVGCEACGCPIVGAQLARAVGDEASETLLRTLFLPASPAADSERVDERGERGELVPPKL